MKVWNVAIYVRVSTVKEEQEDSVPTQIRLLQKHVATLNKDADNEYFNVIKIYADRGISGITTERKEFLEMQNDIDAKKINMILIKDFSRLSRNYLQCGNLLEIEYVKKNIRVMSVMEGYDSIKSEEMQRQMMAFKNIFNESFIADTSKKIRIALTSKMEAGSVISSKPPYGFKREVSKKNGKNKHITLVPKGDETTEVVKEIFKLYLDGWGFGRIATHLNKKGILTPSQHFLNFNKSKFKKWTNNTIKLILTNEKYAGILKQGKTQKINYKIKESKKVEEANWIDGGKFKGIVTEKEFFEVQNMLQKRGTNYRYKGKVRHPFSGVLVCGTCGGKMAYRKDYKGYKCTNSQLGGGRCTPHSVKEVDLLERITDEIKRYVETKDKEKYYKKIEQIEHRDTWGSKLMDIEKEIESQDDMLMDAYTDKTAGKLKEKNFNILLEGIQKRQDELEKKKKEIEDILSEREKMEIDYQKIYQEEIDKVISLKEIDRKFVEKIIDKIIVSEEKQEKMVEIYFKFIK